MEVTKEQPLLSRVKSLVEPTHAKGLQPYYT
jgi:hypothetical protein